MSEEIPKPSPAPSATKVPIKSKPPIPAKPTTPTPVPTPTNKTVENRNLIGSLLYLKQNNLMTESKSTIKFTTTEEAEDSAKEEITTAITEKLNSIKQDISELQKAGYNLKLDGIRLLRVPLKVKVWLSTTKQKDLEGIFQILSTVSTVTSPLKKEKEQKEIEKEKQELEEERLEKEKAKEKPLLEKMFATQTKPLAKKPISKNPIAKPSILPKKIPVPAASIKKSITPTPTKNPTIPIKKNPAPIKPL